VKISWAFDASEWSKSGFSSDESAGCELPEKVSSSKHVGEKAEKQ